MLILRAHRLLISSSHLTPEVRQAFEKKAAAKAPCTKQNDQSDQSLGKSFERTRKKQR
jgi:hypothetical protein